MVFLVQGNVWGNLEDLRQAIFDTGADEVICLGSACGFEQGESARVIIASWIVE